METLLAAVVAAQQRVEQAQLQLDVARTELRAALRTARDGGETVSELARRLDLSRTRVQQLLGDTEEP
jgi:DNA-binding MarR family transcriptional regulator